MDKIKLIKTPRGFARGDFEDIYESKCSIQESSLAGQNAIWLGVHEGSPLYPYQESVRMHLNQDMARQLLPLLAYFVETGRLMGDEG